jgi:hypothetical protein
LIIRIKREEPLSEAPLFCYLGFMPPSLIKIMEYN